jgi:hypothetical protein
LKSTRILLLVCAVMTLAASVASAHPVSRRVDRREWRQHARIHQGWRSGQLTRVEHARLRAGQRHIHRMERHAERDGHLSRFERRRLERAQDRESRAIWRLKHNRRVR